LSSAPLIAERAARPAPARILRRVFSFPAFLAAVLAVLAVLAVRGRFDDPDMWWHLRMGEVISATHSIPTTDLFSYTANHHAIVPQEWLSEALIYGAYKLGGYSGLMLWLCFFTAALFVAGYILCSLYSGNLKIAFLGAMTVWLFSTVGLAVRPQLIGYLLLVFELILLHLGRKRNPRWFFGLPVLFVLWVNCHGSFFLGLAVLVVFGICSFFSFQAGSLVCERWEASDRKKYILAAALSAVVVFLNPGGVKQVLYPVNTMLRQPVNLSHVVEWQPLAISDPRGVALLGILALIFLILIVRHTEVLYLHEALLLAMGAWFALSHQRLAFVFGILAAPIVSRLLATFWDGYDAEKDLPVANAVLITVAALVIFLAFPSRKALAKQVDAGSPVKAVEYIKAHHFAGNMLNAYGYGGYMVWALPEYPDFVDGRADLFEWAGVLPEFGQWAMLQADPNTLLDKYHVAFCVIEHNSPMSRVMTLLPNWKQVYSDDASVIFVRTTVGNLSR
jgi:hypothetical protein